MMIICHGGPRVKRNYIVGGREERREARREARRAREIARPARSCDAPAPDEHLGYRGEYSAKTASRVIGALPARLNATGGRASMRRVILTAGEGIK